MIDEEKNEEAQLPLIDIPMDWENLWVGMPEYNHKNMEPYQTINVHFKNSQDRNMFADLVKQTITSKTKFIWYPKVEIQHYFEKYYKNDVPVDPSYPIYIISKGRWESRLTSKALERMNVPYRIVIEPQEYEKYAGVISPDKILVLPFSNLGQGSIPGRNWIWEHSISVGAKRHWILDDNISHFYRFNKNTKHPVLSGVCFKVVEDFVDRYQNIAIAGINYNNFTISKSAKTKPFYLNTRIYSCILINNDIPYRWRGRYNEDTDLSLRVLKDGFCTILFNAFVCEKATTMTMKGGNTDELYREDGRLRMAQSLKEQHPDIVKITWRFNRWQHSVNYLPFRKNKLILKPNIVIEKDDNDYGMDLQVLNQKLKQESSDG